MTIEWIEGGIMKFFVGALAMLMAVPGLAQAANLSGTYAIHLTEVCQSIEKELFNPTQIQTIDEGKVSQTIGFITFKPTAAGGLSGTVSASVTQAKGTLAILGLPGGTGQPGRPAVADMKLGTAALTGTYSITVAAGTAPSTFNITFKGDTVNSFASYFSQLSGATYSHMDFIGTPSNGSSDAPSCANSGSLQHS
jgi:hypothetical protein